MHLREYAATHVGSFNLISLVVTRWLYSSLERSAILAIATDCNSPATLQKQGQKSFNYDHHGYSRHCDGDIQ